MSLPSVLNLEEVQGDDWSITMNFIDTDGYAIDLSTSTCTAQIRRGKSKTSSVVASFTVDATDAATGVLVLTLGNASSNLLSAKTYYYDVQQSDYFAAVTTLVGGKITIQNDVTA
jgi:hypothetical protein